MWGRLVTGIGLAGWGGDGDDFHRRAGLYSPSAGVDVYSYVYVVTATCHASNVASRGSYLRGLASLSTIKAGPLFR